MFSTIHWGTHLACQTSLPSHPPHHPPPPQKKHLKGQKFWNSKVCKSLLCFSISDVHIYMKIDFYFPVSLLHTDIKLYVWMAVGDCTHDVHLRMYAYLSVLLEWAIKTCGTENITVVKLIVLIRSQIVEGSMSPDIQYRSFLPLSLPPPRYRHHSWSRHSLKT